MFLTDDAAWSIGRDLTSERCGILLQNAAEIAIRGSDAGAAALAAAHRGIRRSWTDQSLTARRMATAATHGLAFPKGGSR